MRKKLGLKLRRKAPVILYILVLGLVVRLVAIDQSFWLDEATSGLVVRDFSFVEIITKFSPGDFHPPLYYLVLKAWSMVGGTGEIWLRGLSVLFGLATVCMVYLIGKEVGSKSLGNLAALLLAVAPLHVYYSQEARVYAMGAFGVSWAVYLFLRITGKQKNGRDWRWFGVSMAIMFLTDYLLVLMVPVFWGAAYLWREKRKWWKEFWWSHLPLILAFVGWWPVMRQQLARGMVVKGSNWWGALGVLSAKNVLLIPVKLVIGRVGFEERLVYAGVVLVFGGLCLYLLSKTRRKMGRLLVVWGWFLGPLGLGVGLSSFVPVLIYFRFLFVLPAFYILMAAGLIRIKESWFFPVLVVVLVGNAVFLAKYLGGEKYQREDWRDLVNYIKTEEKGNSRVVFVANSQMEGYRYYDSEHELYFGKDGVVSDLDEVWLMRYVGDIFDPHDSVRQKVEEMGYKKVSEHDFGGVVVWRYER